MFTAIGRCTVNFDKFIEDAHAIMEIERDLNNNDRIWHQLYLRWGKDQTTMEFKMVKSAYDRLFDFWRHMYLDGTDEQKAQMRLDELRKKIDPVRKYVEDYNIPFKCLYKDEDLALVTAGGDETTFLLPAKYVTVEEYIDYDHLLASERTALISGIPANKIQRVGHEIADYGTSVADVKQAQGSLKCQAEVLKHKIKDIEDAKIPELAEMKAKIEAMQAEMEAKKRSMMAEMEAKKAEMEAKLEEMEMSIYRLDSEIYAIRCYTGETVEFLTVRKGTPAPADTPLVIHQKLRYLDEELGKIASIYDVDFGKAKQFEALLKYSDHALEVFAPTERSLMAARVSRTDKTFVRSEDYSNLLDVYRKYRGDRICLILRDGENVYIAWTDDDRIKFQDDLFFKPGERQVDPEERDSTARGKYESEESYKKRLKDAAKRELRDRVGRYFAHIIAQGCIDRGMIQFPEKVNVMAPSKYIVKSYADGWITDNKYGELTDMIKRSNASIRKGDYILTVQRVTKSWGHGSMSPDARWNNERGVGDRNRTHDVHASDCEIYPINKVMHSACYDYSFRYTNYKGEECIEESTARRTDEERDKWLGYHTKDGRQPLLSFAKQEGTDEYQYYISLEKEYSETGARANFEVMDDEFWNLTYLNSTWLEYILSTQKTSRIRIGGTEVDFAHLIPYIKTALQFVREREAKVADTLREIVPDILEDTEWPAKLSEYMLEKDLHSFGMRTIKGFIKSL